MRGDGPDLGRGPRPHLAAAHAADLGPTDPARGGADRGQSTVELALVLPVVLVLAFLLVQIGLVVRDQVAVVGAAREGARAAAVSPDPDAPRHAIEQNGALATDRVQVASRGRGGAGSYVQVTVVYRSVTELPLIGPLLPDLTLTADATMRVEQ